MCFNMDVNTNMNFKYFRHYDSHTHSSFANVCFRSVILVVSSVVHEWPINQIRCIQSSEHNFMGFLSTFL